jgi:LPPG:FO 2-phospho-L-lactate transferase
MTGARKVIALSGGIGGAKLALGLKRVLPPDSLILVANTGDDFEHMGLTVCPDIDTLVYTLAGLSNSTQGWGRADETWSFMAATETLGGETWFKLGDGDLAMHVHRTTRLAKGEKLSTITAEICRRLGVGAEVIPMAEQPVRTQLRSECGWLDFQDYFVRQQSRPVIREIVYEGAEVASPPEGLCDLLTSDAIDAIVFCPSNPLISLEPILAVPGLREALRRACAPVIAVSPIIAGQAVKGPTAKMLGELGFEASAASVLGRYRDLIDAFIADPRDIPSLRAYDSSVALVAEDIMMSSLEDRDRVARTVLAAADRLQRARIASQRQPGDS